MKSHAYFLEYQRLAHKIIALWAADWPGELPRVLKTDCYNEVETIPEYRIAPSIKARCKSLTLLESDKTLVDQAIFCYPDLTVLHGDIRDLKAAGIKRRSQDIILDFSTIDHVAEYQTVIQEYSKTL